MENKDKETLYKQFESEVKRGKKEIEEKIEACHKLLTEAEKISEETSTPFGLYMFHHSNSFIPKSYMKKLEKYEEKGLDGDELNEIAECWSEDGSAGWQSSSC